jgi:phasin family protein
MFKNIDELQKLGTGNMDATMKLYGAMSKALQAIAAEIADYSKRSLESSTAFAQELMSAKTMNERFEIQSEFAKAAYQAHVAHTGKVVQLCVDATKDARKPFEGMFGATSSDS